MPDCAGRRLVQPRVSLLNLAGSGLMRNPVLLSRRQFALSAASLAAAGLTGCAANNGGGGTSFGETPVVPAGPPQAGTEIGGGQYKVALILPLSAGGNAGVAAQSMKNAAEMALAEFSNPDIQLLIKDDAGNPQQARMVAGQAMDEGARIILGPLFAQTVQATGAAARPRNIPVIGFSTDASIAARGVYLLSFLPETDVVRVLGYAFSTGKRSYAAIVPENAYGSVVEATFREDVARRGGRVVALERYNKAATAGIDRRHRKGRAQRRCGLHSGRRRCGADDRTGAGECRRQYQARAIARHRFVGRSAHLQRRIDAGWSLCGARSRRLRQFRAALSVALWQRAGADGDAGL